MMDFESLKETIDVLQGIATIIALLVGGVWTYFHFIRGRTYRPRLELDVDGTFATVDETTTVRVCLNVKNVGLSKVTLTQEGSGLRFSTYSRETFQAGIHQPIWSELTAFPILERHDWIEPGEQLKDEILIIVPTQEVIAWRLEAILVSVTKFLHKKIRWYADDIVVKKDDSDERKYDGVQMISLSKKTIATKVTGG